MIDDAVVISTQKDMARVKVLASTSCSCCSARVFCQGQKSEEGILTVQNPLQAAPGDKVKIEIPELNYSKETIRIFGFLLVSSLLGLALGYLAAPLLLITRDLSSLVGLLGGLAISLLWLYLLSRGQMKKNLYPVIIDITKKGENHG